MKRPAATRPARASDTGTTQGLGPDLDLNELLVNINLDKLVLNLELGDDVAARAAAHGDPLMAPLVEPPAQVVQSPVQVVQPPDVPATERRRAARLSNTEIGDDVQVSLPRAARTVLVNVSDTGVLVDTNCQLFPGRTTDVFVKLRGERQALRATVVRSSLHSLTSENAVYRSALHFERIIGISNPPR